MRILTRDEIRQAEREALKRPDVSTLVLIQRAGYAVAQFCSTHFDFTSVCVVCGKGSNGGNGMVAAEVLGKFGKEVSILILAKNASELGADAAAMYSHLTLKPIWIANEADLETEEVRRTLTADLILDAIIGTGLKPPLRGIARKAVDTINSTSGTVVAVDLPSGIDADASTPIHDMQETVVFAHGIATFIAPKPAHVFGELTSGTIAVTEMGVQPVLVPSTTGLQVLTGQEVGIAFPRRLRDSNKGDFGHVLVIAGSRGKAGAAGLAGLAALRTGAGLVTVACPQSIQPIVVGFAPELITAGLPEREDDIASDAANQVEDLFAGKDVVVLGPGLSRNHETAAFIRETVARCRLPLVLDADGLSAFEKHYDDLKAGGNFRVLTLNVSEAVRLIGVPMKEIQNDRLGAARRIADSTGLCVVLTGPRTIVAGASGETWINMTGNPAINKSGSCAVLSGMIGAALARRLAESAPVRAGEVEFDPGQVTNWVPETYGTDPNELKKYQAQQLQFASDCVSAFLKDISVAAAVYLHGLAGDFARDMLHENTVLASDLLNYLPDVFHDCELQLDRALFYLQK